MRFGVALKETCPMCGQFLPDKDAVIKTGVLEVRPIEGKVLVHGYLEGVAVYREVHLTPTERRILTVLAVNLGELVTYADLYEAGCQKGTADTKTLRRDQRHTLRVHITRLRGNLGQEVAEYIETVRGPDQEGGLRLRKV